MLRLRLLIAVVIVVVMAAAAVAVARTLSASGVAVSSEPAKAGAPATLSLAATFSAAHGALSDLEIDLARGFRYDPRAADVCSDTAARLATCPPTSVVGRGTGAIVVEGPYLSRTVYGVGAALDNVAPRRRGDLAGVALDLHEGESQLNAVLFGRVVTIAHGTYGIAIRFSGAEHPLAGLYSLAVQELTTTLEASGQRGALLTNPGSCSAAGWPVQVSMRAGGRTWVDAGHAACRRG